jgi:hypothetical protein
MMKTNAKRKNSAVKKLIPAVGMLALSASMLATSTYAWFTMTTEVTVTGMQVHTVVDSNLLIDNFTGGSWATNDSTFEKSKTQTITSGNVIVPMSTVNGLNFFYTDPDNVKGNGDAIADTYIQYSDLSTLKSKYSAVEAPYLDYHFILKATNTDTTSPKNIMVNQLDLTYSGESDGNKAFRVAFLAKKFETATPDGAKTAPGLPTAATKIYAPDSAANFTSGQAVNGTSGTGTVTYGSQASDAIIASVAANSTEYYEVTVRLWLEGEDTTCKVQTFKGLTSGQWSLDIGLTFDQTKTGVYNLNMQTTS